jgi:NADP-dependent 3-hydroxy acid dehydrogenase YdfG
VDNAIVITGAGGGLGKALAVELDKQGERLVLVGRRESSLLEVASTLKQEALIIEADLSLPSARSNLVQRLSACTKFKALVHNAAVVQPFTSLASLNEKDWHHIMSVNVDAPLFLTQQLLPKLENSRVLFLSSGARHLNIPMMMPYCISKEVLSRICEGFKIEHQSVHFASVCPGVVDTPMMSEIRESDQLLEDEHRFYQGLQENNILLTPQVIAKFLAWLILNSPLESYADNEWDVYQKWHQPYWADSLEVPDLPNG